MLLQWYNQQSYVLFKKISIQKHLKLLVTELFKSVTEPLGGSKVDSAFHPSEVDKMSTRNFWELSGKK